MKQYTELMRKILDTGKVKEDTRGQPSTYLFGETIGFDLRDGFPLITTRAISWKSVVVELLWFISGDTTIKSMEDEGVKFWKPWADSLGQVESYGGFWRKMPLVHAPSIGIPDNRRGVNTQLYNGKPFITSDNVNTHVYPAGSMNVPYGTFDQFGFLMDGLWADPFSRRHKLDNWIPQNALVSKLPPCPMHYTFDVVLENDIYVLNCALSQRSADVPVGLPFNIATSALLMEILVQELNRKRETRWVAGELKIFMTNAHVYEDQIGLARGQIFLEPKPLPKIVMPSSTKGYVRPEELKPALWERFRLDGYDPHPAIQYPVQV